MQSLVAKPVSNPATLETALSLTDDTMFTNLFAKKSSLHKPEADSNFGIHFRIHYIFKFYSGTTVFTLMLFNV